MNMINNHSDQFNFFGECIVADINIQIKLSISSQEIIHLAKVTSNSQDLKIQNQIKEFVSYVEGNIIHDVVNFFKNTTEFDPLLYAWQMGLLDYTGEKHLLKTKTKTGQIACQCSGLTLLELDKIKKSSVFSMDTLTKETRAGTGCGSCRADLKKIMQTYQELPYLTSASYLRLWASTDISQGEFLCRCKKVPLKEIADLLEKNNQNGAEQVYLKLQTQYGVGISCTDCELSVKSFLS